MHLDILIRDVPVIDGADASVYPADIGKLADAEADNVIEGHGNYLAPGFVDVRTPTTPAHSHVGDAAKAISRRVTLFIAAAPGKLSEVKHFQRRIAGADTNVATGLVRLGFHVGSLSRVGNDAFGRYLQSTLEIEGLDCLDNPHDIAGFYLKRGIRAVIIKLGSTVSRHEKPCSAGI